jgi:hypothetical protein
VSLSVASALFPLAFGETLVCPALAFAFDMAEAVQQRDQFIRRQPFGSPGAQSAEAVRRCRSLGGEPSCVTSSPAMGL